MTFTRQYSRWQCMTFRNAYLKKFFHKVLNKNLMKTSIITIVFPNFMLYWGGRNFRSTRFEIVNLGKTVDLLKWISKIYIKKWPFFYKVFGKNDVTTTKCKKPKKMTHHVWRLVISKRPFHRASIFIKTNDSDTFYMYH